MADFKYIDIQFLDKTHTIKELSFVEFKNFLKRIYSSTDIIITFNELIAHCYKGDNKLNYVEKILVLLNIRGLIFGNEVTFVQNEKNIVINIQEIIDSFNIKSKEIKHQIGDNIYTFNYIFDNHIPENKLEFISNSLIKINDIDVTNISDKNELIPACNFNELYDLIYNNFYNGNFYIKKLDYDINFSSIYTFLESIFKSDLMGLYEMEYKLREVLNFNTYDLENMSLPECKMFMNFYVRDQNDKENN